MAFLRELSWGRGGCGVWEMTEVDQGLEGAGFSALTESALMELIAAAVSSALLIALKAPCQLEKW